jgi:hypothetical protein
MNAQHTLEQRLMHQRDAEFHARRSGFIVRASLMFNVPCNEVTQAQYIAACDRTQQDTVPAAIASEQHLSESSVIEATFPPLPLDPYDVERNPWFVALAIAVVIVLAVGPIVYDWMTS